MAKTIAAPVFEPGYLELIKDFQLPKKRTFARAENIKPFILKWEGGLSNAKSDLASANLCPTPLRGKYYHTNKGITYLTWKSVFGTHRDVDFLQMSDADWTFIFRTRYWDIWQAGQIYSQAVANYLIDWIWASGIYGIKIPQQMLGVDDDGIVGPKTITALNKQNKLQFCKRLFARRTLYYERLVANNPDQKVNFKGWMNRLNDLQMYNRKAFLN